ncbi:GIP, partial [Symbiodinium natans]
MAFDVPTSFYARSEWADVPPPSDDSPQGPGHGGDANVPGNVPNPQPRGDRSQAADVQPDGASWGPWRDHDWFDSQWNRSWGAADWKWGRGGWSSGYYDGYDEQKKDGGQGSASTGSVGSMDGGFQERDSKGSHSDQWARRDSCGDSRAPPGDDRGVPVGWGPSTEARRLSGGNGGHESSRGPSERMIVPSFSGLDTGSDDLGTSARSYLRQVAAWRRMTRMSKDQQGLTLYQHLTDRAWVDSERLDVNRLGSDDGVDYLISWIQDRYLDVQVTQVGRSLSEFFRKLRRKQNQSVRDYMADFDRAFSRLSEAGCQLPDVAAAWVFVDRMGLEEQAELNLLASVGNKYSLKDLQQAAIVHDRGMRKPWESGGKNPKKERPVKKPYGANVADFEEGSYAGDFAGDDDDGGESPIPEEVANDLYQAFLTHETAKQRYRETAKLRGSDAESLKRLAAEKLQAAKARSFCSGCKRRGHWHLDSVCPLNRSSGGGNPSSTSATTGGTGGQGGKEGAKTNFPCHVVHVTWDISDKSGYQLVGITDTACARSVAGAGWMDAYLAEIRKNGGEPHFLPCKEAFKFGASKVFVANYGVLVGFRLGSHKLALKVAVVNGEVPLLISRGAMAKMGMVIDVSENRATFRALDVRDMQLTNTDTGHPAFPIFPISVPPHRASSAEWEDNELQILSHGEQYIDHMSDESGGRGLLCGGGQDFTEVAKCFGTFSTSWMVDSDEASRLHDDTASLSLSTSCDKTFTALFYPKKINAVTKGMLLDENFSPETFAAWWSNSNITNDFWLEDADYLVRPWDRYVRPSEWLARTIELSPQCMEHGTLPKMTVLSQCYGSAGAFSLAESTCLHSRVLCLRPPMASRKDLLTSPMVNRPKTITEFTKAELLAEARARNLLVHEKWSVVELRSAIQEDRNKGTSTDLAGLQNLNLEQLKERAMEAGLLIPAYPTKGALLRLLRGQGGEGPQSLMPFGRYKGLMYKETPPSYRNWALKEVEMNDSPSEELVAYANWWKSEMHRWNPTATPGYHDPEANAVTPYVEDSTAGSSWAFVTTYANDLTTMTTSKAAPPSPSTRTPPRRRGPGSVASSVASRMDQDVPEEISDELQHLEDGAKECYLNDDEGEFHECEEGEDIQFTGSQSPVPREEDFAEDRDDFLHEYVYVAEAGDMNLGGSKDDSVRETPEVMESSPGPIDEEKRETLRARCSRCEDLAKEKLRNKHFEYDDLLQLAEKIPLRYTKTDKATNRGGKEVYGIFLGGMYTYGSFIGISRGSRALPWTTKYINSFMRTRHRGAWSSFVLFRNAATQVHADVHNLANTLVTTVTFGPFSGGELWVEGKPVQEDASCPVFRSDPHGKEIEGHLVNTRMNPYSFDGKVRHATQPWVGERWTLSCFTTRGFAKSSVGLRDELRDLRFPLRGLPLPGDASQGDAHSFPRTDRPRKSTRKSLWKNVTRLVALTSWCSAAAFNWSTEFFPLSRGREAVSLFEIGGFSKTVEVGDMGFDTAEPLLTREDGTMNGSEVSGTIEYFKPAVVWVHGPAVSAFLPEIGGALQEAIELGKNVVFEAERGDPFWVQQDFVSFYYKFEGRYSTREDEPHVLRFNDYHHVPWENIDLPVKEFQSYMVEGQKTTVEEIDEVPRGAEAITFEGDHKLAAEVRSSLKRLHQNMGHPSNSDLARHLRLAGADPVVVEACKKIKCQVFVAVDAFTVYDCHGDKLELLMAIDIGTGYAIAGELQGHSGEAMEGTFCQMWSNTFGAPGSMVLDLESGLQKGLARFSEWHGTFIRPIAGQAHWQQGSVERCIRTWKEVWSRLVDERSGTIDESGMLLTAVNSAMNTLRRDSGYSPSQAVWGRDPNLPEDLKDGPHDEHVEHILSRDRQRAREHSLRVSAKEVYFRCQNDARLRRALLQRSRVAGPEFQTGMHVFFYRKPKNNKNWEWHGPGVIIGREGPNFWVSFSGRCHLVAPEHLRMASGEELGAAFALRATQEDLQRLLEHDFADEEMYAGDDEGDEEPVLHPGDGREGASVSLGDGDRRRASEDPPPQEKALEKELPWNMIPPEQHEGFRAAEMKQWEEHVEHGALEPLTVEQSREVWRTRSDRVLNSRFAYRDKLWSRRREQPDVGWKHKARLVISGHKDPDLLKGLPTHAPTISRLGIHLLLQILASNLENGWIRKPIFGLVDSPSAWWTKFHGTLKNMEIQRKGKTWRIVQCTLDQCIFMVQEVLPGETPGEEALSPPVGYLGVHVDDVLLIGQDDVCSMIKDELSKIFPIREWESGSFDYVGSYIQIFEKYVKVGQSSYVGTRLFEVEIEKGVAEHEEASEVQKHDNMSLIGALSWLASQSRPDLQVGVSMSQQRQKEPTIADVKFTNQLANRALQFKDEGLLFHPIDLNRAVLLCYHDAGWANVPQNQEDPYYRLTAEEDDHGLIQFGAMSRRDAKAKRANSTIASQLGSVYIFADSGVLSGVPSKGSIVDWRSGACDRVCRSTFAAETMACCTATETGDYITKFMETLLTGKLARKKSRFELRFLSDCRSLYDHLVKDGVPRAHEYVDRALREKSRRQLLEA